MLTHEQASAAAIDRALDVLAKGRAMERSYKSDRDFATTTDFTIEDEVRSLLGELTPDIGFLGEERGRTGPRESYWCLDPIDGTTNFSRGLPTFGIALALIEHETPAHGEIVLPDHRERYATRDGRAYRDNEHLQASQTSSVADSVVAVGDFATGPASRDENRDRLRVLGHMANTVGRVRMLGSAATDLAWLAAGRLDAVVIHSNNSWDVAAGVALARTAGAIITHHDGSPYTLTGPNILAAAPRVHNAILAMLNDPPTRP
ncbi:inositol monophosphatase [Phytoactinopolyspora alkaliphila]|uniref:inositol-phosphate phosphatase n=1 Tax=Phytoactinopolyspora alkaliphila TaxID=1783498 RepID=A0A6N9YLJ6_9ACTN|nr:inositol monophosphatase family protein [Phytoactinopolyspora alkaliphila]NED95864.1 inositol monophosphatase [Phytoactinopolyspora alkaliphila]